MSGYSKNVAVIKGLKEGFSANGGALSGLVRAEKYGASLKVEISLINFAPLAEGRYVAALSDGENFLLVEGGCFEGASLLDTSEGFAAGVFFVNGGVVPVASAVCGPFYAAALGLRQFVEEAEGVLAAPARAQKKDADACYEDEAIAEENYYEYAQTDQDGGAVCAGGQKAPSGRAAGEDAPPLGAVQKDPPKADGNDADGRGVNGAAPDMLARGNFYEKMREEIEKLLSAYPAEEALCRTVENSRWVRIRYDGDAFYVFGVIYAEGAPQYICYGVPARTADRPPESMAGMAGFIPSSEEGEEGYWVMYQDAATGASLHISFE